MINYYYHGMNPYTYKKEIIAYMIRHDLPARNLKRYKGNKYRYYVRIQRNKWLTTYYFNGADWNKHKHPRALDVRVAHTRA